MQDLNGILLIDKPVEWTSFDVVAKIRGLLRTATGNKKIKVGHAGTLDPFATGLLIVMVGKATKLSDEFLKKDKTYTATLKLGFTSTTGDPEGEISQNTDFGIPNPEAIASVLESFKGEQLQTPPAFSAIKINGQRAYNLARQGKEVVIEPRRITIHELESIDYKFPLLQIKTNVSSGTYIRTLGIDIGAKLGCSAYLTELRRTSIDKYSVDQAITVEDISIEKITKNLLPINI